MDDGRNIWMKEEQTLVEMRASLGNLIGKHIERV